MAFVFVRIHQEIVVVRTPFCGGFCVCERVSRAGPSCAHLLRWRLFLCRHFRWLSILWHTFYDFFLVQTFQMMAFSCFVRTFQVMVVFVRTFYDVFFFVHTLQALSVFVHAFYDGFCART